MVYRNYLCLALAQLVLEDLLHDLLLLDEESTHDAGRREGEGDERMQNEVTIKKVRESLDAVVE